ncbi:MAG: hypothetical protein U0K68_01375 [Agathobacter sp.]|jgi:hypothetical protein|nr:hypothetical protein [Agathobacter sp.]
MTYPVNQVILGGDPLNSMPDFETQMQLIELQKARLQQLKQQAQAAPQKFLWDDIDAEIKPLSDEQKERLMMDNEYLSNYNAIQMLVQTELINLIKGKLEANPDGKELLQNQLRLTKRLKSKIIEDTQREMQAFKRFKEYSKSHPEVTYDEFIKANM